MNPSNDQSSSPSRPHPQMTPSSKGGQASDLFPGTPPPQSRNPLTTVLVLSGIFFLIFLGVSATLFLRGTHSSKPGATGNLWNSGSIGVLELNGVIMDSKRTLHDLESLEQNASVYGILLRLNSPGGSVAPSQEIYQAIRDSKKPIYASMSSVAASGAFYVAMGAKRIFANAGTITGSIGVIMEFANLEKLYEWAKIKRYSIKTGRYKDAGADYRGLEPDERALLQGMIDNVLGQFKQAVSDGRKVSLERVTEIADGRIFSGEQAKKLGLVDELGSEQDAIKALASLVKIKEKKVPLIYPDHPRRRLLDLLLDSGGDDEEEGRSRESLLSSVLHVISGRAPRTPLSQQVTGLVPGIYWLWTP